MDAAVVVGTQKGLFVFRSEGGRSRFAVSGPHLAGLECYAVGVDGRSGALRLLAGTTSEHWGSVVQTSDDLGQTWSEPTIGNVKFPPEADAAVHRIWQLQPAGASEPGVVYAGVEPATLYRSEDGGATFTLVQGLWDHPHRPRWEPGAG